MCQCTVTKFCSTLKVMATNLAIYKLNVAAKKHFMNVRDNGYWKKFFYDASMCELAV